MVGRIPYAGAIKGLQRKKFENLDNKHMTECTICMQEYAETDEIAELKCD